MTLRFRGREMVHQDIGRKLLDAGVQRSRPAQRGRAEPADGRQADGHGVCAKKEVDARKPVRKERRVGSPASGVRMARRAL